MKTPSVYSTSEQTIMKRWQQYKDSRLRFVTRALSNWGVSPTMISIIGVVIAGVGLYRATATHEAGYFIVTLWLHVFNDSLDGALARNHQQHHPSGEVVDVVADYAVAVVATLYLILFAVLSLPVAITLTGSYGLLLLLAYWRNRLGIPYHFILRGRLFIYTLLTIDVLLHTSFTALAAPLAICSNLLFIMTGLFALHSYNHHIIK